MKPAVTRIDDGSIPGRKRYRIEGGTLAPEWADSLRRRGRLVAWCEFTIWNDDDRLGSYGGEVWPAAWPDLFAGTGDLRDPHRLTEAGRAAVQAAEVRS